MAHSKQEQTQAHGATAAGILSVSDPSELEVALHPWELLCLPLTRGAFRYHMAYVTTPSVTFYRETYDISVSLKGTAPPGMLAFAVPLVMGRGSQFWKSPLSRPGFPSTLPGGLDVVFTAGHDHIVVLVALDLLRQALPPDEAARLENSARQRLLPATPGGVERFGQWLLARLDTVVSAPELLHQPFFRHSVEQDLVRCLANTVHGAVSAASPPPVSSRRRALERALTYLYGASESQLTVPELCQIAGTSQRTLEYAFRETFDMTPRTFLMQRRLHAVRRILVGTGLDYNVSVSAIAHAHGFYELGRFAGEYAQTFGELPSATLRAARGGKSSGGSLSGSVRFGLRRPLKV